MFKFGLKIVINEITMNRIFFDSYIYSIYFGGTRDYVYIFCDSGKEVGPVV